MKTKFIGLLIILTFIGFAIGRYGDKWGGHLNTPHHWIYGLILFIVGIYLVLTAQTSKKKFILGWSLIAFGIGHFISDLQDFIDFRIWGVDVPHKWKFWSID